MTTRTTATAWDQSTDAAFQTWVAEFISMLTSVGLVQTNDTGQINPATVTRAGVNTIAGYAIFRMNDSMQSSAPIFIRVEFGSGSAITNAVLNIKVGTGTNGAGTLSGGDSATTYVVFNLTPSGGATAKTSYACAVDGCFWIVWKQNGSGSTGNLPAGVFFLARYTDSTGAPTAGGYSTLYSASTTSLNNARSWNFTTSAGFSAGSWTSIGGQTAWGVTSSLVSGQPQVYQMNYITPRVQPHNFCGGVINNECSLGVQYQATMIGSTSRNYINAAWNNNSGTGACLGVIWE